MDGSDSFRDGVWIAIVIIVLAIGGLFVARYFHDNAAPAQGSATAPVAAPGGPRLVSGQG